MLATLQVCLTLCEFSHIIDMFSFETNSCQNNVKGQPKATDILAFGIISIASLNVVLDCRTSDFGADKHHDTVILAVNERSLYQMLAVS